MPPYIHCQLLSGQAEELRDARAVDIRVEYAGPETPCGETQGQVDGNGALSYPAFSGQHHEGVADPRELLFDRSLVAGF